MTQEAVAEAQARPREALPAAALKWLRANLFSTWWNALLTVLILWLLVSIVAPLFSWAISDAVWGAAPPEACTVGGPACWAVIYEKYRLILFGLYPYDEQWRPMLAMMLFVALLLAACNRDFWRPWLAVAWALGAVAIGVLMWGGVFGLTYVENTYWGGLPLTLFLSAIGLVVAFPLGVLLALGRRSHMPVVRMLCVGYIELIRGVPLVTVLFMASLMLPLFLPQNVRVDAVVRAIVAVTLFSAAYLAENVRGGLQALPRGQTEAARALGLNTVQTTLLITLPQALRAVIPVLVGQFISLFKDTSLVVIIGLTDLLGAAQTINTQPQWLGMPGGVWRETFFVVAAIYWVFSFTMSRTSKKIEERLNVGQR